MSDYPPLRPDRHGLLPSNIVEEQVQRYMNKYLRGELPFFETDMLYVKVAQNKITLYSDQTKIESLCRATVINYLGLVPFCQKCGSTKYLWIFNKKYIYCGACFTNNSNEKPIEITAKNKILLRDVIPELDLGYSEYTAYVNKNYSEEIEYHTLDEKNYLRGCRLLSSPKFRKIAEPLTKKQRKRLYVLSKFLCQSIITQRGGKQCPSFGEHIYLLVNKS